MIYRRLIRPATNIISIGRGDKENGKCKGKEFASCYWLKFSSAWYWLYVHGQMDCRDICALTYSWHIRHNGIAFSVAHMDRHKYNYGYRHVYSF